jgi:hypothetical protein
MDGQICRAMSKIMHMRGFLTFCPGVSPLAVCSLGLTFATVLALAPAAPATAATTATRRGQAAVPGSTRSLPLVPLSRERVPGDVRDRAHRRTGQQPHRRLPVRGQQHRDPVAGPGGEVAWEEVGGLGHPIGEGGHGQFDAFARGVVVEGHQGASRVRGERGTQQVGRGAVGRVHPGKRTRAARCAPSGRRTAPPPDRTREPYGPSDLK